MIQPGTPKPTRTVHYPSAVPVHRELTPCFLNLLETQNRTLSYLLPQDKLHEGLLGLYLGLSGHKVTKKLP